MAAKKQKGLVSAPKPAPKGMTRQKGKPSKVK